MARSYHPTRKIDGASLIRLFKRSSVDKALEMCLDQTHDVWNATSWVALIGPASHASVRLDKGKTSDT